MAQNPPMAFPVIDDGVCVPYPTKTRKIQRYEWVGSSLVSVRLWNFKDSGS